MKTNLWNVLVPILVLASNAMAEEIATSSADAPSSRMKNRIGAYIGVGEPAPGLIGVNVAYNVTDYLRAQAGYGSITATTGLDISGNSISTSESTVSTFGAGVRGMVPGWKLTPTLGLHYGLVSYSGSGLEVSGFQKSGGHLYTTYGFDYQADGGFNVGGGMSTSLKSGVGSSFFLNAGWFFDFFG